jgi:hypothetical protein
LWFDRWMMAGVEERGHRSRGPKAHRGDPLRIEVAGWSNACSYLRL